MKQLDAEDLPPLDLLQSPPAPAPSGSLLAEVEDMRPVSTHVPWWTLLIVAAASCVYPLVALAVYPLRRDLGALPVPWLIAVALAWLAGFVVPLTLALVPRSGQVLPDGARAGRAALLAALTLVLMGLVATRDAPGVTILPQATWSGFSRAWWGCVSFSIKVSIPAVLVAGLLMRRFAVARLGRLGAAVGAAAGALAGLVLHGLCPVGGALHVGLSHGGGVVIGGLLGALWLPIVVRAGRTGR